MKHLSFILTFLLFAFRAVAWADSKLPQLSTDTEKHYYLLRSSYTGNYVSYTGNGPSAWTTASTTASGLSNSNVFYFTSNSSVADDGSLVVKIHCLATENIWNGFGDWTTEGGDWTITPQTYNDIEGFSICKVTDGTTDYLDYSGQYDPTKGRHLAFLETSTSNISEPAAKLDAVISYQGISMGTYKSSGIPAVYKALQNYDSGYTDYLSAVRKAKNCPISGHYYTIVNANNGKYVQESYTNLTTNGNNKLCCTQQAANVMPSLWQFEQSTTNTAYYDCYYIKAANSGSYMALTEWYHCEGNGGTYLVNSTTDSNIGMYDLFNKAHVSVAGSVTLVYYTDIDRTTDHRGTMKYNSDDVLHSYNAVADGLNNWYINEVTSIPVTISDVKYATLNLPCTVTIPENVSAYIGTLSSDNKTMQLTALSGTIPANTPVILVAQEAGTYSFAIDYDASATAPENNALSGTLIPSTVASEATAYTLQNSATAGVGLYKVTDASDRTIPANKAYYGSLTSASAPMLGFSFAENGVTGIQTVNSNADSQVYYDLNGRRVLFPVHGVYVNGRGEKVFIK